MSFLPSSSDCLSHSDISIWLLNFVFSVLLATRGSDAVDGRAPSFWFGKAKLLLYATSAIASTCAWIVYAAVSAPLNALIYAATAMTSCALMFMHLRLVVHHWRLFACGRLSMQVYKYALCAAAWAVVANTSQYWTRIQVLSHDDNRVAVTITFTVCACTFALTALTCQHAYLRFRDTSIALAVCALSQFVLLLIVTADASSTITDIIGNTVFTCAFAGTALYFVRMHRMHVQAQRDIEDVYVREDTSLSISRIIFTRTAQSQYLIHAAPLPPPPFSSSSSSSSSSASSSASSSSSSSSSFGVFGSHFRHHAFISDSSAQPYPLSQSHNIDEAHSHSVSQSRAQFQSHSSACHIRLLTDKLCWTLFEQFVFYAVLWSVESILGAVNMSEATQQQLQWCDTTNMGMQAAQNFFRVVH